MSFHLHLGPGLTRKCQVPWPDSSLRNALTQPFPCRLGSSAPRPWGAGRAGLAQSRGARKRQRRPEAGSRPMVGGEAGRGALPMVATP